MDALRTTSQQLHTCSATPSEETTVNTVTHVLMFRYSKRTYSRGDVMEPHVSEVIHGPHDAVGNHGLDGELITYVTTFASLMHGWLGVKFGHYDDDSPLPTNFYMVRVAIEDAEARHLNSDMLQWICRQPITVVDCVAKRGGVITPELYDELRQYDKEVYDLLDTRNPDDDDDLGDELEEVDCSDWVIEKSALPTEEELRDCEQFELSFDD